MQFNLKTILYGLVLAFIDSIALPILKGVLTGEFGRWMLGIPIGLFALMPLIFFNALKSETLTVMNLVFDVLSGLIITGIGLFYFKEKISFTKKIGVILSFISVFFMTYEGNGWSELLG